MEYEFGKVDNKVIEGWLGDSKEKTVLFVMKEPNDKHTENFFLYDAIYGQTDGWDNKAKRTATRMINIFGSLARKITKQDENEVFNCRDYNKNIEALKSCAFINLSPFSGEGTASVKYNCVVKVLNNVEYDTCQFCKISKESNKNEIAENRLSIIKNIECDYIVVIDDVFENYFKGKGEPITGILKPFKNLDGDFKAIELGGKKIYSFCHHANRRINYSKLNDVQL